LLVDTYDIDQSVRAAVELAGAELGAVRIDSGDLADTARRVRRLLDELGASKTRIVATSDLDEHTIAQLRREPVDGFGVGTSVVTGSGAPTAGFVYKLVARSRGPEAPLEPVAKTSSGKIGHGGAKSAARRLNKEGIAVAEVVYVQGKRPDRDDERALTVPLVRDGRVMPGHTLEDLRSHHRRALAELPTEALRLSRGSPALDVIHVDVTEEEAPS
jgi:nicotinate phosphoribosyltransferase